MDNKAFLKLNEILKEYGWTMEEAIENLNKVSNTLINYINLGADKAKDILLDFNSSLSELRPETDAKTEIPNQKFDLEIFTPICSNRDKPIIITAENSQFDKDLLSKHFNIDIKDEDDWIREALYGEIEI